MKSVLVNAIPPAHHATASGPKGARSIAGVIITPSFVIHRSVQNAFFVNGCFSIHLPNLLLSEIGLSNRFPILVIIHPSCFTLYASSPLTRICTFNFIVCAAICVKAQLCAWSLLNSCIAVGSSSLIFIVFKNSGFFL